MTYTWGSGVTVGFAGSATDPEDGTLAASQLHWLVIWHDTSDFVIAVFDGVTGGSFTAPTSLSGQIEIKLTAFDSLGLSTTVSSFYNHR